ncbi:MAG: hypothetical protein K0Q59_941 [Paenibacillus sp.]|jgi:DNA-binding MarR family transcriptional regulator|nr:hypothetical protein [Paenibacillus sp.]
MMSEQHLERIDYEMVVLIRRASLDKELGGMDRSSYTLLMQLSKHGNPVRVKELADEFHLDISTVSRQTTSLETKGYLQRLPDPTDGRSSMFQLTDEGKRTLAHVKKARVARYAELLKTWNDDERHLFGKLLERLNRTFVE